MVICYSYVFALVSAFVAVVVAVIVVVSVYLFHLQLSQFLLFFLKNLDSCTSLH